MTMKKSKKVGSKGRFNLRTTLKGVRLVVMDVDGVMTRGDIIIDENGKELKIFNVRDGSGIKYLMRQGIPTAIISARPCEAVVERAKGLGMTYCVTNATDKLPAFDKILADARVAADAVCYIGDDLPDIPPMRRAGLPVAVADAVPEVIAEAKHVTKAAGGCGAIREMAELILKAQGKWADVMRRYLA